jgi:hypothetical protein
MALPKVQIHAVLKDSREKISTQVMHGDSIQ